MRRASSGGGAPPPPAVVGPPPRPPGAPPIVTQQPPAPQEDNPSQTNKMQPTPLARSLSHTNFNSSTSAPKNAPPPVPAPRNRPAPPPQKIPSPVTTEPQEPFVFVQAAPSKSERAQDAILLNQRVHLADSPTSMSTTRAVITLPMLPGAEPPPVHPNPVTLNPPVHNANNRSTVPIRMYHSSNTSHVQTNLPVLPKLQANPYNPSSVPSHPPPALPTAHPPPSSHPTTSGNSGNPPPPAVSGPPPPSFIAHPPPTTSGPPPQPLINHPAPPVVSGPPPAVQGPPPTPGVVGPPPRPAGQAPPTQAAPPRFQPPPGGFQLPMVMPAGNRMAQPSPYSNSCDTTAAAPRPRVPVPNHHMQSKAPTPFHSEQQAALPPASEPISPQKTKFDENTIAKIDYTDFSNWESKLSPVIYASISFIVCHGLFLFIGNFLLFLFTPLSPLKYPGIHKEGLFRVSGAQAKIDALLNAAKAGSSIDSLLSTFDEYDVYSVADFLLRWLQIEFESLITLQVYKKLIENLDGTFSLLFSSIFHFYLFFNFLAIGAPEIPRKLVKGLVFCLSEERLFVLCALLQTAQLLSDNEETTKMNAKNLATCITPNIMYDPNPVLDISKLQKEALLANKAVEFLIEEFPYLAKVFFIKKFFSLLLSLTLFLSLTLQDIHSGRYESFADRYREELDESPANDNEPGDSIISPRGRSTEDDRKKKSRNPFARLSRSRSRNKKKSLKK